MQWEAAGLHATTRHPGSLIVDADDEASARRRAARRGLIVSTIVLLDSASLDNLVAPENFEKPPIFRSTTAPPATNLSQHFLSRHWKAVATAMFGVTLLVLLVVLLNNHFSGMTPRQAMEAGRRAGQIVDGGPGTPPLAGISSTPNGRIVIAVRATKPDRKLFNPKNGTAMLLPEKMPPAIAAQCCRDAAASWNFDIGFENNSIQSELAADAQTRQHPGYTPVWANSAAEGQRTAAAKARPWPRRASAPSRSTRWPFSSGCGIWPRRGPGFRRSHLSKPRFIQGPPSGRTELSSASSGRPSRAASRSSFWTGPT